MDDPLHGHFEQIYLKLRTHEQRVYSDEIVSELPFLTDRSLLKIPSIKKEWKIRSRSTKKLIHHLKRRPPFSILEVGCGNGWLSHCLAAAFPAATVQAIDINETELRQAQRVFGGRRNLTFTSVDIFSGTLGRNNFDCIVIAGSIQYFRDLRKTINALLETLAPNGEIHLIDSPFYSVMEINKAMRRSAVYFESCGCPEMIGFYHHHLWKELEDFNFRVAYDPLSTQNRLWQKIRNDSPFPWLIIS